MRTTLVTPLPYFEMLIFVSHRDDVAPRDLEDFETKNFAFLGPGHATFGIRRPPHRRTASRDG
jgi:hypothetical protein